MNSKYDTTTVLRLVLKYLWLELGKKILKKSFIIGIIFLMSQESSEFGCRRHTVLAD